MIADLIPGISTADLGVIVTVLLFVITAWLTYLTWQNVNAAKESAAAAKDSADAAKKLVGLTKENVNAAKDSVDAAQDIITAVNDNVSAAEDSVFAVNELIEFLSEPLVFIDANWDEKFLPDGQHLVVKIFMRNRGGGPARDIKIVNVKNDFPVGMEITTFSESEIAKDGIIELAPGQDMLLARLLNKGSWRNLPSPKIFFEYKTVSAKRKVRALFLLPRWLLYTDVNVKEPTRAVYCNTSSINR